MKRGTPRVHLFASSESLSRSALEVASAKKVSTPGVSDVVPPSYTLPPTKAGPSQVRARAQRKVSATHCLEEALLLGGITWKAGDPGRPMFEASRGQNRWSKETATLLTPAC